nr:DarT ssDNA thymidine ADP-ribosyltransferase family protein [uncultured Shimia sp.]
MKDIIAARQINYILHFTQLSNLEGILARGILPRVQADSAGLNYTYNDQHRWDGHTNATCCSIGFPNYKMFWQLRCKDPTVEWVVIALKPDILLEKPCAFYPTNAASNTVRHLNTQSFAGPVALANMFADVPGKPTREALKLPDDCTTDPQAEVLVFDTIQTRYIEGVATASKKVADELTAKNLGVDFVHVSAFFSGRKDAAHWKI